MSATLQSDDDIRQMDVSADKSLTNEEKETTINIPNDTDYAMFASDVPTTIKWVLSISESEIKDYRTNDDGAITYVKAHVPKGVLKLQSSARKSDAHCHMVAYGDER